MSVEIQFDTRSILDVAGLLRTTFPKLDSDTATDYAKCACLLSDSAASAIAMTVLEDALLDSIIQLAGRMNFQPVLGLLPKAKVIDSLNSDELICDFPKAAELGAVPISVSMALKQCFRNLDAKGFNLDAPASIFSDAMSQNFISVVTSGCLFIDGVTAGHGEFTHTIQWLLFAAACKSPTLGMTLKTPLGEL